MQPNPAAEERDRKYAWDYFQLHSSQRIASFNFYITLSTALIAGASAVLQPSVHLPLIALVLSIVLILMSFVFWKLDQRNKMLIKGSEEALKEVEVRLEAPDAPVPTTSLFRQDEQLVAQRRKKSSLLFWNNHFSYSNCFNLVFVLFGLLGIMGIVLSLGMIP